MRVLDVTTLFPSRSQPALGSFVFRRAQELSKLCDLHIVVGVGLFPILKYLPRYKERRATETHGKCGDAEVSYIRYLSIPRYLKRFDSISFSNTLQRAIHEGRIPMPDVITAELVYPDGDVARRLSGLLGRPYFVTARGHDLNDFVMKGEWQKQRAALVLAEAAAVTPVANALSAVATRLAPAQKRIVTIENGVDSQIFGVVSKTTARAHLNIRESTPVVVSVGHLVERKGHHLVISAVAKLRAMLDRDIQLIIVGGASEEGDFRQEILAEVERVSGSTWVTMTGALPQDQVAQWITAADALVLASSKEGRPNVVLESFACGTPVVATRVWGTPELLSESFLGELCDRSTSSLEEAIGSVLAKEYDRERIKAHVQRFSWHRSARRLLEIYSGGSLGD